jgi:hypothetical protein
MAETSCIDDGTVQVCTGDLSQGIVAGPEIATLMIGDLTRNIEPASGTGGVTYLAAGQATLLSDTSGSTITVTGADGISVASETGATFIRHAGAVTVTDGRGIVATADNGAAAVEGSGAVTATGDAITLDPRLGGAALTWNGAVSSTGARAVVVKADNGGASAAGAGTISAAGDAVTVDARGADGDASFNWDGDITTTGGAGVRLNAANGGTSVTGSGTVIANDAGMDIRATGSSDNATLTWTGAITSQTSTAAHAQSATGGASVQGGGAVTAALDGLSADARGGNATIVWDGDVQSGLTGLLASADNGGATVSGSGAVMGATGGIVARNRSAASAVVDWQGDVTAVGGQAISATSANGGTTVKGAGRVQGASEGISVRNTGNQTASLNWIGDITGTSGFGAELYSATGAVASTTHGMIIAGTGGINAASGGLSNSTVSVNHDGDITAGGVGIEARSPQAPVAVRLTGDLDTGSFGILALSQGGSTVSVDMTGDILRSGHAGIDAKSATGVVAVAQAGTITSLDVGIVARNAGGNTVSVTRSGDLTSALDGIDAQSSTGIVTVTHAAGSIDAGGTAIRARNMGNATVNVNATGDIIRAATGIDASSSNGAVYVATTSDLTARDSGISARSGGTGEVGVTHSGDLSVINGSGIVASSVSGDISAYVLSGNVTAADYGLHLSGSGNFSAGINDGVRIIGGADFAGVYFENGLTNSLNNAGYIGNAGGIDSYAIRADGNDIAIDNHGTISGNIVLGPFANALRNHETGLLETGSVLIMAEADTLRNSGTISVGRSGEVQTTALTGNLDTTVSSKFVIDLDMAANADRIDLMNVSGSASLSGGVSVNFLSVIGDPQRFAFITTGEGVTAQDLTLDAMPFLNGGIEITDNQDVHLVIDEIIFAPLGISGNARDIAGYFQRAVRNGASGVSDIAAQIANLDSVAAGQLLYEELSPEIALSALTNVAASSVGFADTLMSCRVASGLNAAIAEGDCDWFKTSYTSAERTTTQAPDATITTKLGFSGGFQRALDMTDWRVGAALGLSELDATFASGSAGGTQFNAGVVVKYAPGPFVLSAGLSNGWGSLDMIRTADLGKGEQALLSQTDSRTTDFNLRGAYAFDQGSYYIKPQVDLHAVRVRSDAYTETGGSAALAIEAMDDTYYSVSASVELGADLMYDTGHVTRGFVRLGSTHYSGAGVDLQGRLASDLSMRDAFIVSAGNDRTVVDVAAGITSFWVEGWSAELLYTGSFADNIDQHGVVFKLSAQF